MSCTEVIVDSFGRVIVAELMLFSMSFTSVMIMFSVTVSLSVISDMIL